MLSSRSLKAGSLSIITPRETPGSTGELEPHQNQSTNLTCWIFDFLLIKGCVLQRALC